MKFKNNNQRKAVMGRLNIFGRIKKSREEEKKFKPAVSKEGADNQRLYKKGGGYYTREAGVSGKKAFKPYKGKVITRQEQD